MKWLSSLLFLEGTESGGYMKNEPERIVNVLKLELKVLMSNPPRLIIKATGEAKCKTPVYAALIPWSYQTAPSDGIYDLDFVVRPSMTGETMISSLEIEHDWGFYDPEILYGIRVHARENHIETPLEFQVSFTKQLTSGQYMAQQRGNNVFIWACGAHQRAHVTWLEKVPQNVDPPEFALYRCEDVTGAMPSFCVSYTFQTCRRIDSVIIHDQNGAQKIDVARAEEAALLACV